MTIPRWIATGCESSAKDEIPGRGDMSLIWVLMDREGADLGESFC